MHKNIIFDLGNVLLDFNPKKYFEKKIDKKTIEAIQEIVFESKEWLMLDKGIITEKNVIEVLCGRRPEHEEAIRFVFKEWYDVLQPIEKNIKILRKLKEKGYKLYFLSNFHTLAFEKVNERYDFFELFDGGIVSCKVNLLKPEKKIYETLLETYGLEPKECVFIDDTKKNVDTAEALGITGIWLEKQDKLEHELEIVGIK